LGCNDDEKKQPLDRYDLTIKALDELFLQMSARKLTSNGSSNELTLHELVAISVHHMCLMHTPLLQLYYQMWPLRHTNRNMLHQRHVAMAQYVFVSESIQSNGAVDGSPQWSLSMSLVWADSFLRIVAQTFDRQPITVAPIEGTRAEASPSSSSSSLSSVIASIKSKSMDADIDELVSLSVMRHVKAIPLPLQLTRDEDIPIAEMEKRVPYILPRCDNYVVSKWAEHPFSFMFVIYPAPTHTSYGMVFMI
jgi:hypothetical protein